MFHQMITALIYSHKKKIFTKNMIQTKFIYSLMIFFLYIHLLQSFLHLFWIIHKYIGNEQRNQSLLSKNNQEKQIEFYYFPQIKVHELKSRAKKIFKDLKKVNQYECSQWKKFYFYFPKMPIKFKVQARRNIILQPSKKIQANKMIQSTLSEILIHTNGKKTFLLIYIPKITNTYLMFDQRMNRPQSDQFFFQLEPQVLFFNKSSTSKDIVNGNSIFRMKLMKGFNQCDQMKKKPTQISTDGKVIFPYTQLTFYLPTYNPDRPIYFTLLLLKSQQGKEEKEIGKYAIKSSQFIEKFKKQQKRLFQENIAFNSQYELTFNLFIDKSRIQLEKFVREVRQSHKTEGVKEKEAEKQPVKHKASLLSQSAQGRVSSTNQDGFISSQRKIVRKQGNQRKLLIKNNNSPQRSQDGSQRSRELKFSRKSSQRSPVLKSERRTSLADQQIRIEKEARKLVEENKFKEETRETGQKEGYAERIKLGFLHTPDNKQSKIQNHSQDDGILDFDSDKWGKSSKNLLKLSDRKGDHPPMMKKTGSQLFDQKGKQVYNREKPQKKKQLHESSLRKDKSMINKPQNTTNQNILMGAFLLISCYILYLVMQPSRKF